MNKITLPTTHDVDLKYYTDGNKIYFGYTGFGDNELKGADLATFELYIGWFAKDKDRCYFDGVVFKNVDIETFETLSWVFAKDKNSVYTNKGILKDADPQTFEIIGGGFIKDLSYRHPFGYGKDANHVFLYIYDNKIIKLKDADVKSFVYITDLYGKDENFVFWSGMKLKNANPKTWKLLKDNNVYSSDGKNAYCGRDLIKGVDVETFELFIDKKDGGEYAKDKNYIYNGCKRIGISRNDWFFNETEIKEFIKKDDPKHYAKWYGRSKIE
jgi:hypothetical protein